MEKRLLLAFVLSMAFMTVWLAFFSPTPKQSAKKAEQSRQEASRKPSAKAEKPAGPHLDLEKISKESLKAEPASEKLITIETPLYVARVSTRGATLLSWKLKKYRETLDKNSPLIELIKNPGQNGRALELRVKSSIDEALNALEFQFDRQEVRIQDAQDHQRLRGIARLAGGISVIKEMVFYGDRYAMDLSVSLCDEHGLAVSDRLGILWPHSVANGKSSRFSGFSGPVVLSGDKVKQIKKIEKYLSKDTEIIWAGYSEKYFLSSVMPLNGDRKMMSLGKTDDTVTLTISQYSNESKFCNYKFKLYLGPKTINDLKKEGEMLSKALSFGFFDIIARPLLITLHYINKYTLNFGIAIIILTIIIKLLFWPLTHKSYKSMKEMQRIQPRMKQIRERFKNDKEQLNREMMLLYKTHKVNPLGGCLPMVLQIPVFFALYRALLSSIELRHAPFIFWIKDLAAPDYLIHFPSGVSFFGIEGLGPLPLIMGLSMVIQQKMTPTMGDPAQAKIMMLMPIFFTFIFISFPSGLVLYWLMNNLLSIVQQVYINARIE